MLRKFFLGLWTMSTGQTHNTESPKALHSGFWRKSMRLGQATPCTMKANGNWLPTLQRLLLNPVNTIFSTITSSFGKTPATMSGTRQKAFLKFHSTLRPSAATTLLEESANGTVSQQQTEPETISASQPTGKRSRPSHISGKRATLRTSVGHCLLPTTNTLQTERRLLAPTLRQVHPQCRTSLSSSPSPTMPNRIGESRLTTLFHLRNGIWQNM